MEPELDGIYAEINRKRAILGIVVDPKHYKKLPRKNNQHRQYIIGLYGILPYKTE